MPEPTSQQSEAFEAVRAATALRARAQEQHDAAVQAQVAAIQAAIAAGVSTLDLAAETGMSRARIYQIRDGRR